MADWVGNLPVESATRRAADPRAEHTFDLELLRRMDHTLRWLQWSKTKSARRNRDRPDMFRFPWEPKKKVWDNDVFEWDEAAEKLGGDPRLAELMAKF